MRRYLAAAAVTLLPVALGAQGPLITRTDPAVLLVRTENAPVTVTLHGERFWPGGPNNPERWAVDVRRSGGAWVRAGLGSGNASQQAFTVSAHPLIQSAGTLEVRLIVDGTHSNTFAIPVRVERPRLLGASPATIPIRPAMTEANWTVTLNGEHWVPPFHLRVGGQDVPRYTANLNAGHVGFVLPPEMRRPGRYPIVVRTPHGESEARAVVVVAPFVVVSTTPGRMMQAALQDASAEVPVTVSFTGTPPDRIAWKTDRTTAWVEVPASYTMRNDALTVQLPVSALRGSQMIEMKVTNAAGDVDVRIPIDHSVRPGVEGLTIPQVQQGNSGRVNPAARRPPPVLRP